MFRLIIFKPYVDQFGGQISYFDDYLFWNNTQPLYIRDDKNNIREISNKNEFNPYFPTLQLSTLDVRYDNSIILFFCEN